MAGREALLEEAQDLLVFRFKGLVIGAEVTGGMLRYRICIAVRGSVIERS